MKKQNGRLSRSREQQPLAISVSGRVHEETALSIHSQFFLFDPGRFANATGLFGISEKVRLTDYGCERSRTALFPECSVAIQSSLLPVPAGSFDDMVLSTQVLEHVPEAPKNHLKKYR
jgi:hypothetical protein